MYSSRSVYDSIRSKNSRHPPDSLGFGGQTYSTLNLRNQLLFTLKYFPIKSDHSCEIFIISEEDCTKLETAKWSDIKSPPELPVVHGTTLTLKVNCPGGYTNLGGSTAKCLYGQIILTGGLPNCVG